MKYFYLIFVVFLLNCNSDSSDIIQEESCDCSLVRNDGRVMPWEGGCEDVGLEINDGIVICEKQK